MTTTPTPPSAASHTPGPNRIGEPVRELYVVMQADGNTGIAYKLDYGDGPQSPVTVAAVMPRAGCCDIDAEIVRRYNAFPALLEALHAAIAGMATIQAVVPSFRKALDEPLTIARAAIALAEKGA